MKHKGKFSIFNLMMIVLLIACLAIGGLVIVLTMSKEERNLIGSTTDEIKKSYTSIESTTNEWDVSKNGDGSVMATLTEDGTLTISGSGEMRDWDSSDTTDWHRIEDDVESVIIKEGVTNIGNYAFYDCGSLETVEISNTVTNIGDYAFDDCYRLLNICVNKDNRNYMDDNGVLYKKGENQTLIKYPNAKFCREYEILDGTKIIGNSAFEASFVLNIKLPETIVFIGENAFSTCLELMNIEISSSVKSIGDYAFAYCNSLTSIKIPSNVTNIGTAVFFGCSFEKLEIEEGCNLEGEGIFEGCEIVEFIETNKTKEVSGILKKALEKSGYQYGIGSGTLEDGILRISEGEENLDIDIIRGPFKGLVYILSYNTIKLKEDASIIATLSNTGTLTISGSGEIDKEINSIIRNRIKKIIVEDGITGIKTDAFYYCFNVTTVEIPRTVKFLGEELFVTCISLTNIIVNDKNETYMDVDGVLYTKGKNMIIAYPANRNATEYTILNDVSKICRSAFAWSKLTNINIPDKVTSIEDGTFGLCTELRDVYISKNVTSIGNFAFLGCENLRNIEIPSSVKKIEEEAFTSCPNLTIICENDTAAETYAKENNINYLVVMPGIKPQTTAGQVKQKIESNISYEVVNLEGKVITDTEKVGTGYKVKYSDGEENTIIVWGDFSGDAHISVAELARVSRTATQLTGIDPIDKKIIDVSGDGKISVADLAAISRLARE